MSVYYMVKKFKNLHCSSDKWQLAEKDFDNFQKTFEIKLGTKLKNECLPFCHLIFPLLYSFWMGSMNSLKITQIQTQKLKYFIWLRNWKICVFHALNGNLQKRILITSNRLLRLNLLSNWIEGFSILSYNFPISQIHWNGVNELFKNESNSVSW